jgi:hypothetical protein
VAVRNSAALPSVALALGLVKRGLTALAVQRLNASPLNQQYDEQRLRFSADRQTWF